MNSPAPHRDIITNRKARHLYHIVERMEAGVALQGSEVKMLRAGKGNLVDAFARVENGEIFLYGCDIPPYDKASHQQHVSKRPRKLLMHRREIQKLEALTAQKGMTLVALRLYWKNQRVKVEIGVGKGKNVADKRETLKERASQQEVDRALADARRGRY